MATLKYSELRDAFEFVSADASFDNSAYVDPDTGAIFWVSSDLDLGDEIPDDLATSDRYIAIPDKRDLDLGRDLVLSFVDQESSDDYGTVSDFFRRKGAYRRFKDFLASRGLLEKWHSFEESAIKEALRQWCRDNNLGLSDENAPA